MKKNLTIIIILLLTTTQNLLAITGTHNGWSYGPAEDDSMMFITNDSSNENNTCGVLIGGGDVSIFIASEHPIGDLKEDSTISILIGGGESFGDPDHWFLSDNRKVLLFTGDPATLLAQIKATEMQTLALLSWSEDALQSYEFKGFFEILSVLAE